MPIVILGECSKTLQGYEIKYSTNYSHLGFVSCELLSHTSNTLPLEVINITPYTLGARASLCQGQIIIAASSHLQLATLK
jgi:hypothetical protein